jgi:integrase
VLARSQRSVSLRRTTCNTNSRRTQGTKPPAANMLVADYLRVAAKKAGVVAPPRTFGFHTFRRTLASVLVKMKVDPKLVQEMLRHQNLKTTLEVYANAATEDKREAQGMFLELLFRGRKAAEPDPVKSLEKTAPVFVEEVETAKNVGSTIG